MHTHTPKIQMSRYIREPNLRMLPHNVTQINKKPHTHTFLIFLYIILYVLMSLYLYLYTCVLSIRLSIMHTQLSISVIENLLQYPYTKLTNR